MTSDVALNSAPQAVAAVVVAVTTVADAFVIIASVAAHQ